MKIPRRRIFNNIRTSHVAIESLIEPGVYSIYPDKDSKRPVAQSVPAFMIHPPSADWDEVLPEDNSEKIFFKREGKYARPDVDFKIPANTDTYKIAAFEVENPGTNITNLNILSVLRNSDNKLFSVNKMIGNPYSKGKWETIKSIKRPNNDFQIVLYTESWATLLHDAIPYEPVLTTNDGTTVFENDAVNCINAYDPDYKIYDHTIDPKVDPRLNRIYFACVANAENYQLLNVKKLSINDLKNTLPQIPPHYLDRLLIMISKRLKLL
jgi:hypothetical protein